MVSQINLLAPTVPPCFQERRPHILVIDGENSVSQMLGLELVYEGYEITTAQDGVNGLIHARTMNLDLLILGWALSDLSCLEICRRLRSTGSSIPIIIITSGDSADGAQQRIASFKAGANDAVSLPFTLEELIQRIQRLLQPFQQQVGTLSFDNLVLNRVSREVFRGNESVELTAKEFDLLEFFMRHPNQVLTRSQILDNIWGFDFMGDSNIIEVYVRYLRLKLEAHCSQRLIQTIRGVGYVLRT